MAEKKSTFVLSAFGDEIDDDIEKQFQVLNELDICYLDLRKAWGINVADLDDRQIQDLKLACRKYSIKISCIGSPVGKSLITDNLDETKATLKRILDIAVLLETDKVRIFSFYPPQNQHQDKYIEQSVQRLKSMADLAKTYGIILIMENENGLVGDTPERCRKILDNVGSNNLRFVWDTGNFPHSGVENSVDIGWPILSDYVECVQIKDARLSDRKITVAGEGDGQILKLLQFLRDHGYHGFLALEPHLKLTGQRGGFSGPGGMLNATKALRDIMNQAGCIETKMLI